MYDGQPAVTKVGRLAWVNCPPSTQIAESLELHDAQVCAHGQTTCHARCGVYRSGAGVLTTWRPIPEWSRQAKLAEALMMQEDFDADEGRWLHEVFDVVDGEVLTVVRPRLPKLALDDMFAVQHMASETAKKSMQTWAEEVQKVQAQFQGSFAIMTKEVFDKLKAAMSEFAVSAKEVSDDLQALAAVRSHADGVRSTRVRRSDTRGVWRPHAVGRQGMGMGVPVMTAGNKFDEWPRGPPR